AHDPVALWPDAPAGGAVGGGLARPGHRRDAILRGRPRATPPPRRRGAVARRRAARCGARCREPAHFAGVAGLVVRCSHALGSAPSSKTAPWGDSSTRWGATTLHATLPLSSSTPTARLASFLVPEGSSITKGGPLEVTVPGVLDGGNTALIR